MDIVRAAGAGYDIPKTAANYVPLTPLSFLARTAAVFPDRLAVSTATARYTWRAKLARCRRLASALAARGRRASATRWPSWRPTCRRCSRRITACHDRRRAERAELPARRGHGRLHPRPRRGQRAHHRPRVLPAIVAAALDLMPAERRPSSSTSTTPGPARRAARRARIRGVPGGRRPGLRLAHARPTNGTRSRSTTPPAPPATRRAW